MDAKECALSMAKFMDILEAMYVPARNTEESWTRQQICC